MFESLSDRLQTVFQKLGGKGKLSEDDVREGMKQVRLALLEADVNFKVVKDFVAKVTEQAIGEEDTKPGPTVILLNGLQGAGKTTLAAKLALYLRKKGKRPLLVAADVYRPAAIAQLESLGKQLNIPVHSEGTQASPPDIARNALQRARNEGLNYVIVDTAGRLQIDDRLMIELEQIDQAVHPTEKLLVVDSMIGQEAVKVAEEFHRRVGLTGVVMTKVDGDARGGAALSVRAVTGVPIKFLSTGEKVSEDTLEAFHPERLASRILGMGDMLSLIERAEQIYDEDESKKMEKKLRKGSFDFEDFLAAMQQMRKLGPLQQILAMIPGMGQLARNEELVSEKDLKRIEAIIFSMTKQERRNPDMIKGRRKERIAKGSGTQLQDVTSLVGQFKQMQRMMKKMSSGGGKGGSRGGMDPRELMRRLR